MYLEIRDAKCPAMYGIDSNSDKVSFKMPAVPLIHFPNEETGVQSAEMCAYVLELLLLLILY